jgi:hypothetical protein
MNNHLARMIRTAYLVTGATLAATAVQADVTVQQKNTLDVASLIKTHGSSTSSLTADKKREDSESHCEGMMSLVCGNLHGGEIVRLDRGLTWHLEPDKKSYREDVFATPAQLAEVRAEMQARLDKMRSCPVSQRQQPVDKSKCEMSPPKIDVHKTDDRMSIAGHDTQRTLATLTESCTNKDTGDVCDTVVALDVWLTQDTLPGTADRRAFGQAYAKKLGLEDAQGAMRAEFAKFLAPYQTQIKQLTDKSSDLKGQPLKTSMRVLMGGPKCSSASKTKANGSSGDSSAGGGNPMANMSQAGKAMGNLMGGLFKKKKTDDSQAASSGDTSTANAPPSGPDPFAQYTQLAAFSTETVSISTDVIPADRFEIPAGWKKDVPPPSKKGNEEFTCPKVAN